jgi:hypothetical protein
MDKVLKYSQMVIHILDNINLDELMALANTYGKMEIIIMEIGLTE